MSWKKWGDLSPTYRKRLERQGITAKTHLQAKNPKAKNYRSLKKERGKGEHTPSVMRQKAEREKRLLETPTVAKLVKQGSDSGISRDVIEAAVANYGISFVRILLAYKEYRHNLYVLSKQTEGHFTNQNIPKIDDIQQWAQKQGYKWKDDYDINLLSFDYDHPLIRYQ